MEDWEFIDPKDFPYNEITNGVDGHMVYGCFVNGKLEGIIRVDDRGDEHEVSWLFVNKALQNDGIGQSLFSSVVDWFGDKDLVLYVYTDNDNAIHIYKKYGFKVTGTDYDKGYRPEDPHYEMKRRAA
jgi:ribosomal protein S18 acetylase RimI-like enzyme